MAHPGLPEGAGLTGEKALSPREGRGRSRRDPHQLKDLGTDWASVSSSVQRGGGDNNLAWGPVLCGAPCF